VAWSEAAQQVATDPRLRADLALLHGRALAWMGQVGRAHSILSAAGADIAATDSRRSYLLSAEASLAAAMYLDISGGIRAARRCQELATVTAEPDANGPLLLAVLLAVTSEIPEAKRELQSAMTVLDDADPAEAPMELGLLGQTCNFLERYHDAYRLFHKVLDGARRTVNPAAVAFACGARSEMGWWLGQWSAAYADATEAAAKGRALRHRGSTTFALLQMARIEAARGDSSACARHVADALEFSAGTEIRGMPIIFSSSAVGIDRLSQGAYQDAVIHLDHAFTEFTRLELGNPLLSPFAADLVEAHLRAGNPLAAREVLAWLEDLAKRTGLVWPAAVTARCRALLADDPDEAAAAFETAMAEHDLLPVPFERARTLLSEGAALRRGRRKGLARAPLLTAHRLFSTLGATPWIQRCLAELTAGAHLLPADIPGEVLDQLTPQELQVARTVADGLNNVEVGAALFISVKTVEAHLTHIYRKLGLRSRTALTRVITTSGL
jgi:DNA-binding CsgD family transcriptional regulator